MTLPAIPESSEPLARFIREKSKIVRGRPTWKVFQPWKKDNATSVFRIVGLAEAEVWLLDDKYRGLAEKAGIARADITVEAVRSARLQVSADNDPPRHAAIVGWPNEAEDKSLLMWQMRELASLSTLVLRPESAQLS